MESPSNVAAVSLPRRLLSAGGLAWIGLLPLAVGNPASALERADVRGELRAWHRVTVCLTGPSSAEDGTPNPFLDYRFDVVLERDGRTWRVPGFFAADGDAAESSAESGTMWQARFLPDKPGTYSYRGQLVRGEGIAVADLDDGIPSTAAVVASCEGSFRVEETDKALPDHRAAGLLRYVGGHYLRFAGSGAYFLKGGADSPENFLAYAEFDGTYDAEALDREGEAKGAKFLHAYGPHVRDWSEGDPSWRDGRGKGIIGALNYLASQGMNSVYFLTMNVGGDGKDVWPWTSDRERFRFDVSKLEQWEVVFSHMDRLGILLHVVTQETENDQLLNGGELGPERRLYYRELVARFAHHPALVWNLGEENTNTTAQRKAFSELLRKLDPYDHPIVIHTYPGKYDEVYRPLLGHPCLEGPSLQTTDTHAQTVRWVRLSREAGRPWVVCLDEIGPADTGVKPDVDDLWHDEVRRLHLWGNLMGGGAGVEWYFGYKFAHNDLNCEDWRSRENLWSLTRIALRFFRDHLPFSEMVPSDDLLRGGDGYCLADAPRVYAVYSWGRRRPELYLADADARYDVLWYDPRSGGDPRAGSVRELASPGNAGAWVRLGDPPGELEADWAILIRRRPEEAPGDARSR